MTLQLVTGEMTDTGFEYPPVCPLGVCGGNPEAETWSDGFWRCDECGKKLIHWNREAVDDKDTTT